MTPRSFLLAGAALAAITVATTAQALTITNGVVTVGIGPSGELYDQATNIGFRTAPGVEAITHEYTSDHGNNDDSIDSWSVGATTGSPLPIMGAKQFYNYSESASREYTFGTEFSQTVKAGASKATSVSENFASGIVVIQKYSFVGYIGNILKIDEEVVNRGFDSRNFIFQRDWNPNIYISHVFFGTSYDDNSVGGMAGGHNGLRYDRIGVLSSSYTGNEDPEQTILDRGYVHDCNFNCNVRDVSDTLVGDGGVMGGGIMVDLGMIDPGQSRRFQYYYGVSMPGQGADSLALQAWMTGVKYYILTQSADQGAYPGTGTPSLFSTFIGVSLSVPEPATWAMMITGFGLVGVAMRRHRPRPLVS